MIYFPECVLGWQMVANFSARNNQSTRINVTKYFRMSIEKPLPRLMILVNNFGNWTKVYYNLRKGVYNWFMTFALTTFKLIYFLILTLRG